MNNRVLLCVATSALTMLIVLVAIKVKNEFKMTKAYQDQAVEQKRVADVLEAEKDLSAKVFKAQGTCEITRYVYRGSPRFGLWISDTKHVESSNDKLEGKVVTDLECKNFLAVTPQ